MHYDVSVAFDWLIKKHKESINMSVNKATQIVQVLAKGDKKQLSPNLVGYRLPLGESCDNGFLRLLNMCWTQDPQQRPSFQV